jgi:hypothetical protein
MACDTFDFGEAGRGSRLQEMKSRTVGKLYIHMSATGMPGDA